MQHELDGIADFVSLPDTRKIATRHDILLSPAKAQRLLKVPTDDICIIEEPRTCAGDPMLEGCGFISKDILLRLLGAKAQKVVALQVRISYLAHIQSLLLMT